MSADPEHKDLFADQDQKAADVPAIFQQRKVTSNEFRVDANFGFNSLAQARVNAFDISLPKCTVIHPYNVPAATTPLLIKLDAGKANALLDQLNLSGHMKDGFELSAFYCCQRITPSNEYTGRLLIRPHYFLFDQAQFDEVDNESKASNSKFLKKSDLSIYAGGMKTDLNLEEKLGVVESEGVYTVKRGAKQSNGEVIVWEEENDEGEISIHTNRAQAQMVVSADNFPVPAGLANSSLRFSFVVSPGDKRCILTIHREITQSQEINICNLISKFEKGEHNSLAVFVGNLRTQYPRLLPELESVAMIANTPKQIFEEKDHAREKIIEIADDAIHHDPAREFLDDSRNEYARSLIQHVQGAGVAASEEKTKSDSENQAKYKYSALLKHLLLESIMAQLLSIGAAEQKSEVNQDYPIAQKTLQTTLSSDNAFLDYARANLCKIAKQTMVELVDWFQGKGIAMATQFDASDNSKLPCARIAERAEKLAQEFEIKNVEGEGTGNRLAESVRQELKQTVSEQDQRFKKLIADIGLLQRYVNSQHARIYSRERYFMEVPSFVDKGATKIIETGKKCKLFKQYKAALRCSREKLDKSENVEQVLAQVTFLVLELVVAAHHHATNSLIERLFMSPKTWTALKALISGLQTDALKDTLKQATRFRHFGFGKRACMFGETKVAHFQELYNHRTATPLVQPAQAG